MSVEIVRVKTDAEWNVVKNFLSELLVYENLLRPERKEVANIINGSFSYVKENIDKHQGAAFLAVSNGEHVGFGTCWIVSGSGLDKGDNRYGHLSDTYVLPNHRHQGIYKKLLEERKNYFKSLGIKNLDISTLGNNADMHKILTRLGFKIQKITYEIEI